MKTIISTIFTSRNFRTTFVSLLFSVLFIVPNSCFALNWPSWKSLWFTPNQQGAQLLSRGEGRKAANQFANPLWKGVANYRSGQYQKAVDDFSNKTSPLANYNRGNALAYLGKYQQAIAAYTKTLQQDPNFEDARYNKNLLEKILKQKPKKQSNSSKQNEQQKNSQKNNNQSKSSNQSKKSSKANQSNQNKNNQPDNKNNNRNKNKNDNNQSKPQTPQQQSQQQSSQQNKLKPPSQQKNKQQDQPQDKNQDQQQSPMNQTPKKSKQLQSQSQHRSSNNTKKNKIQQQALKQWLQQIPDNPGGLLKQKFLRDHWRLQMRERMQMQN